MESLYAFIMKIKVSDLIAKFFEAKGIKHGFGIIGSANAHIFDSIFYNTSIELICNHHEQACVMAAQTYWNWISAAPLSSRRGDYPPAPAQVPQEDQVPARRHGERSA